MREERANLNTAIEKARNKRIYDDDNRFIDAVITSQGQNEYDMLLKNNRQDISGETDHRNQEETTRTCLSKLSLLHLQHEKWIQTMNTLLEEQYHPNNEANIKHSYFATRRAKRHIRAIINTLQLVRQEEWVSSKNHLIRIGKYGAVAKMIHPKQRAGPTAGKFYPTKPMEPTRQAINNRERMEATLITHRKWMDNPPGKKNCIFLDTTADEVGVNGITVNPEKPFDDTAQWEYLEGMLEEKTNIDIANRVRLAHDRLPVLF